MGKAGDWGCRKGSLGGQKGIRGPEVIGRKGDLGARRVISRGPNRRLGPRAGHSGDAEAGDTGSDGGRRDGNWRRFGDRPIRRRTGRDSGRQEAGRLREGTIRSGPGTPGGALGTGRCFEARTGADSSGNRRSRTRSRSGKAGKEDAAAPEKRARRAGFGHAGVGQSRATRPAEADRRGDRWRDRSSVSDDRKGIGGAEEASSEGDPEGDPERSEGESRRGSERGDICSNDQIRSDRTSAAWSDR